MEIVVEVSGEKFVVEVLPSVEREGAFIVKVNGEELSTEIVELKPTSITLAVGGWVGFFEYVRKRGKLIEVIHANKTYEVDVRTTQQEELERLLERFRRGDASRSVEKQIVAPMPGKILDIYVKPGDRVELGQVVGVLEAMKMENELGSTVDGVVKEVKVKKGDNVQLNQVLIELE